MMAAKLGNRCRAKYYGPFGMRKTRMIPNGPGLLLSRPPARTRSGRPHHENRAAPRDRLGMPCPTERSA
jgi:hypothetical protein